MFFGKNLKYLRKNKKLSQENLGKNLNLTRDSIASLELERAMPSFETLINIRNYFNVNLDDLIFEDLENKQKER